MTDANGLLIPVKRRLVRQFSTVHPDYGRRIADKLQRIRAEAAAAGSPQVHNAGGGVVPIRPAPLKPPRHVPQPRCPYGYSGKL